MYRERSILMDKMIKALYRENQSKPTTRLTHSQEFYRAQNVIKHDQEFLIHNLKGEQKSILIRLLTTMNQLKEIECVELFIDGIRNGAQMRAELQTNSAISELSPAEDIIVLDDIPAGKRLLVKDIADIMKRHILNEENREIKK